MKEGQKQFIAELESLVATKHSKDHRLIEMIEQGALTPFQLRGFVLQFYQLFAKPFPRPIAALLAQSPRDGEIESAILENLFEEGRGQVTGTASHHDLFLRFAEGLGLSAELMDSAEPLPETSALLNLREILFTHRSFAEAAAAQGFALEGTSRQRMERLVRGFRDHYRISEDLLSYWSVHIAVEDEHGALGPLVVEKLVSSKDDKARVRRAVQETLDAFWLFHDGVIRCYVEQAPGYERFSTWLRDRMPDMSDRHATALAESAAGGRAG